MPAQLDDPSTPAHYRRSGATPYPTPTTHPTPSPRPLALRATSAPATLFAFTSPTHLPASLTAHLAAALNAEIDAGDTYPMLDRMTAAAFGAYWFGVFGAVALAGAPADAAALLAAPDGSVDWDGVALGTFYVKPNYPGRSSHVCNAGFLVCAGARGRGVGRALGEAYVDWAPRLGYSYSVFNLVYATNPASWRIWDALGFERIGCVPGCGNLRCSPGKLVDAYIYGRRLGVENAALERQAEVEVHEGSVAVDGV